MAAERAHTDAVILLLSQASIDINAQDADGQITLGCTVFKGDAEVVSLLIQDPRVRTDDAYIDGVTPLSCAIAKKNVVILHYLERLGIYSNHGALKMMSNAACDSGG